MKKTNAGKNHYNFQRWFSVIKLYMNTKLYLVRNILITLQKPHKSDCLKFSYIQANGCCSNVVINPPDCIIMGCLCGQISLDGYFLRHHSGDGQYNFKILVICKY